MAAASLSAATIASRDATVRQPRRWLAAHRHDALIVLAFGALGGVSHASSTMHWFVDDAALGMRGIVAYHVVSNVVSCIVFALLAIWLEQRRLAGWRHVAAIMAAVLVVAAANGTRSWLEPWQVPALSERGVGSSLTGAMFQFWHSLLLGALTFAYFGRRRAQTESAERLVAVQARQRTAARRVASARLQALTARVDPQLLFELLDSVQRAYQVDPRRAEQLLDELTVFLRAALSRLRQASSTVAQECELAASYARMLNLAGSSAASVETALGAAAQVRFPPGVLLPIAEDVLRAGGGAPVAISAALSQQRCALRIASPQAPQPGTLDRAREMLELHDEASAVESRQSDGHCVTTLEFAHEPA